MARDPFRPVDDAARELARRLLTDARHGALAVLEPDGQPMVTRVAVAPEAGGPVLALVSDLAPHTAALRTDPRAGLMVGEPGRGDPLAHPRLSLRMRASFVDKAALAEAYLSAQPKAKLYIGFGDFHMVRLAPVSALLNGGFGQAYRLAPEDLA